MRVRKYLAVDKEHHQGFLVVGGGIASDTEFQAEVAKGYRGCARRFMSRSELLRLHASLPIIRSDQARLAQ